MADQLIMLKRPISNSLPHIFKRPLLSVNPSDSLLTVATFLALGPQIYVDGLVVLDGQKTVGVIGGRNIIEHILYHKRDWLKATAKSVMSDSVIALDATRPLNDALDIFRRTGFGFLPISINEKLATSLSVRDILRVAIELEVKTPVSQLSSLIISIKKNASIGSALEIMLGRGVRNLVVHSLSENTLLTDRMILEYLLSFKGRQKISGGLDALFETSIGVLEPLAASHAAPETMAKIAAERLMDINTPCLLLGDDSIVTPWDIVMKGLRELTV